MSKGLEDTLKAIVFFVSGLISGVALGLLTAPKSGKELREDLSNESYKLQKATKENLEELQNIGISKASKFAHAIQDTTNTLSSKIDDLAKTNGRTLTKGNHRKH